MQAIELFVTFLPYLCLLGTIHLYRLHSSNSFFPAIAHGAMTWSLIVWCETNILSFLDLIYGNIIAAFWIIYFLTLIPFILKHHKSLRLPKIRGWSWIPVGIAVITLIIALAYPPNNFDVMTYHMPRVAHWLQNHTMAPYPSSIDRQIGMAPFNAMVALQSWAPAHLDYFVNLGQWLAFLGCLAGVYKITAMLGGSRNAQVYATVFLATLPACIVQASNTESCLIVSFYICVMVWAWLEWQSSENPKLSVICLLGSSLGLAILSKGSAYPIALPFVCLVALRCLKRPKKLLLQGFVAAFLVVMINVPHMARAMEWYGTPIASSEKNIVTNPTPKTLAVNALYNFLSNQPVLLGNGRVAFFENLTTAMGVDINDKSFLPWGGLSRAKDIYYPGDSQPPNPFQAVFLIFVAGAIIFCKFRPPLIYTCGIFASFIFFCLLLTWHPWVGRIQIPLFMLVAPLCGLLIASIKKKYIKNFILSLSCFCSIWPLFLCIERPLAPVYFTETYLHSVKHFLSSPRELLFFNSIPSMGEPYIANINFIASQNPENLWLRLGDNGWEYPLWQLLGDRLNRLPKIKHLLQPDSFTDYPVLIFDFTGIDDSPPAPPKTILKNTQNEIVVFSPK